MNRSNLYWGLALLILGILLLLDNLGLLGGINVWAIFWPLALIAVGVRLLWRSSGSRTFDSRWTTPAAGAGTTPPASVESNREAAPVSSPAGRLPAEAVRIPLGSARHATLRFHHGAGELRVDANAAPDELLSGTFEGGLDRQISGSPEDVTVELRVPPEKMLVSFGSLQNWMVGLNPNIPLALDMELGANRTLLDLRDLQVQSLRLQTGASETEVIVPVRAGEVKASVHAGVAGLVVTVPDNVSARIHLHGALTSNQVNTARFPQVSMGGVYASPDYEMAANKVDLDVEAGLGSISVR